ncbi:MAG: hypothetical protein QM726_16020 [Chitinophagaceae bacterium]
MIFNKLQLCLLTMFIATLPFTGYTVWWLANSNKVMGDMWYIGKSYTGQLVHEYSAVRYIVGNDTFHLNTSDNIIFKTGQQVPVRYQKSNHHNARVDMFAEIWGDAVVYGGELALMVLIVFLHPGIIPRKSKIKLAGTRPFVSIV